MAESAIDEGKVVRKLSRMGTVWGIAVFILGCFAVTAPLVSGLTVTIAVAVMVLVAGAAQTVWSFQAESFGKGVLKFLFGGITIVCGIVMLAWPGETLLSLTMFLAAYFVVDGGVIIVTAVQTRPEKGWGWLLCNGIVTVILGALIVSDWPLSGVWAIGVLLGIRLMMSGSTIIALAAIGRRVGRELELASPEASPPGDLAGK